MNFSEAGDIGRVSFRVCDGSESRQFAQEVRGGIWLPARDVIASEFSDV
jgi:hypothetical protein